MSAVATHSAAHEPAIRRAAGAVIAGIAMVALLASAVGIQTLRERHAPLGLPVGDTGNLLYVQSPAAARRLALSFESLVADVYWMRAVQHYGRTKLSHDPAKKYDVLYPLLDLTTTLDPRFDIAYRYGAMFLSEAPPAGPGRPDQAVALLQKGLAAQPGKWEFAQDIGFVYYWWAHDYVRAAEWFTTASRLPGAPNWMAPLAAVALSQGGNRETSRRMWLQIVAAAKPDEKWLREQGARRLMQLDTLDRIDALQALVDRYQQQNGERPRTWNDLVRARLLPGIPLDPERYPFVLAPDSGRVTIDPTSPLNPLPTAERAAARPEPRAATPDPGAANPAPPLPKAGAGTAP